MIAGQLLLYGAVLLVGVLISYVSWWLWRRRLATWRPVVLAAGQTVLSFVPLGFVVVTGKVPTGVAIATSLVAFGGAGAYAWWGRRQIWAVLRKPES